MSEYIKTTLEFLKLNPRYFLVFATISAFLLFADEDIVEQIGMRKFTEDHRPIIGVVFLLACGLTVLPILDYAGRHIKIQWETWRFKRKIRNYFQIITEEEKEILRRYILRDTKTQSFDITDGTIQGLVANGIIRQATFGSPHSWPYIIPDIVWEQLKANQSLFNRPK
jgi:hypothetical protein